MTSRAEEIQRLIADIDDLFAKSGKRLPRLLSGQAAQEPRQVLERIRDFLIKSRESESENKLAQQPQLSPLLAKFADQGNSESSPQPDQNQQQSNVTIPEQQKIDFSALLEPLQAELQALLQERATLVQEIRQLEQRRLHNYSLTQQMANQEQMISEFLQVLMNRVVPITPQITDNLASGVSQNLDTNHSTELQSASTPPFLESTQVDQLTRFTADLDRHLLSLDGTVNVVFEALQRNIHTYHESLSQALARMHSQGVQGEQLMRSFLNNLTSQLQQPPTYLSGENQTSSSPTIIQQDAAATTNLDTVLQFDVDQPKSQTTANPVTKAPSQPNTQLVVNEVDQLYASFFGAENFTEQSRQIDTNRELDITDNLSVTASTPIKESNLVQPTESPTKLQPEVVENEVTPEVINQETNLTDDASALTTSLPESATNEVQQSDSQDPWLQESNVELVDISNPTPAESDVLDTFEDKNNTVINLTQPDDVNLAPVEEPAMADTITVLGELVIHVPSNTSETPSSEVVQKDEEAQRAKYISASPEENLLSQAEAIADSVFDISLDEDQLEQLNQDLADFDRQLNSESQPQINLENQFIAENTLTAAESVLEVLEISPASDEKTEPTIFSSGSTNQPESFNLDGSVWYLGIDLGTTGISAALLNRSTNVVYPVYWSAEKQLAGTSLKPSFRLP
ncbi:MAG: hypothetical protein ICV78_07730, partial [Tolypothrix sp. Co-bin9]|nr:hypothetical protein [Tolypothrix sp. Co-bin9]